MPSHECARMGWWGKTFANLLCGVRGCMDRAQLHAGAEENGEGAHGCRFHVSTIKDTNAGRFASRKSALEKQSAGLTVEEVLNASIEKGIKTDWPDNNKRNLRHVGAHQRGWGIDHQCANHPTVQGPWSWAMVMGHAAVMCQET